MKKEKAKKPDVNTLAMEMGALIMTMNRLGASIDHLALLVEVATKTKAAPVEPPKGAGK